MPRANIDQMKAVIKEFQGRSESDFTTISWSIIVRDPSRIIIAIMGKCEGEKLAKFMRKSDATKVIPLCPTAII